MENPKRLDHELHSVVDAYLALHSPVAPKLDGQATATDAPSTLLTQLQAYNYQFR